MSFLSSSKSCQRTPPPTSQYTGQVVARSSPPTPIMVTPSSNHVAPLPLPVSPLPFPSSLQADPDNDIKLSPRQTKDRAASFTAEDSGEASEDDGQVIDDGTETEEDEVGESDSEEAKAARSSPGAQVQPAPAQSKKPRLDPSSFAGVRILNAADIKVGAVLGSGAFGNVYRANWGTDAVALKEIDLEQAGQSLGLSEEDLLAAFQWEVSRMSTVRHPNLVQFHGVCFKGGKTYLVMEFCSKGSMQGVLNGENVPPARLWQWMLEIAEGLAYLHSQGILHRDLKAENILIDQHGRAKVADLGVAQVDAFVQGDVIKAVDQGLHDLLFIAPEETREPSSKESDIYALGLVFWQMVNFGSKPDSWGDLMARDKDLKDARAGLRMPIPDTCPEPIKNLILSCWQFRPEARASIEQVIGQLRAMGPQLHPDHGLLLLGEQLEQALEGSREDIRNLVPPLVTRKPVEGGYDAYWQSQAPTSPTTTTTTTTATLTTTLTSTATTTSTQTTTTTTTTTEMPAKTSSREKSTSTKKSKKSEKKPASERTKKKTEPALALPDVFDDFLAQSGPGSLVLLGEGGMGKSLSMRALAARLQQQWWQHLADPRGTPRPAWLPLDLRSHGTGWSHAELKNACADLLKRYGIKSDETGIVVLVDGYDECNVDKGEQGRLAEHLGLPPNAKLIITCRPDALAQDEWMQTFAWGGKPQPVYCLPFNADQALDYLGKHLAWDETTFAQYRAVVQGSAELRAVLGNPFLVYLLRQSWSTVTGKGSLQGLTRSGIYAAFIEHIVNAGSGLLSEDVRRQLQGKHPDLVTSFKAYAQEIAFRAWKRQGMELPTAKAGKTGMAWAQVPERVGKEARQRHQERAARLRELGDEGRQHKGRAVLTETAFERMRLQAAKQLMDALPLRMRGAAWEFVHKSVFEYCVAQALLRLVGKGADKLAERKLVALLQSTSYHSPEVLMFLKEALEAARKNSGIPQKEGDVALDRLRRRNEAALLDAIGVTLEAREQFVHAMEYYQQSLDLRLSVPEPDDLGVADSLGHIARMQDRDGNYDESLKNNRKALEIRKKVLVPTHKDTAITLRNIASTLYETGRTSEALEHFYAARVALESLLGPDDTQTCTIYLSIATLLIGTKDFKRAQQYLLKALAAQASLGEDHHFIADVHTVMGISLSTQGKFEDALKELRLALAIYKKTVGEDSTRTARCRQEIGVTLAHLGDCDEALEQLQMTLRSEEKLLGTEHISTAFTYRTMAAIYGKKGEFAKAFSLYQRALRIKQNVFGPNHQEVAEIYSEMGAVFDLQEKYEAALPYYRKALETIEILRGPDHPDTAECHGNIGLVLRDLGKHEEALGYFREAKRILTQAKSFNKAMQYADRIKAIEIKPVVAVPVADSQRTDPAPTVLNVPVKAAPSQPLQANSSTPQTSDVAPRSRRSLSEEQRTTSASESSVEESESESAQKPRAKDCLKVCTIV